MLYVLLIALTVLGYLIYTKLNEISALLQPQSREQDGSKYSIEDLLTFLQRTVNDINNKLNNIDACINAEYPAGEKSSPFKRRNNLIEIYAKFLESKEKLSESEARLRARFEVYEFGEKKIIDEINRGFQNGLYGEARRKAVEDFEKSGILQKDARSYWTMEKEGKKGITPFYLAEPMYDVLVRQNGKKGDLVYEEDMTENVRRYRDMVEREAIIFNLEKLNVLEKTTKESFSGKVKYKLLVDSFETVKDIVYGGETSHDNDYFEEKLREGKLNNFLYVE